VAGSLGKAAAGGGSEDAFAAVSVFDLAEMTIKSA
jgi:hypothetical protein